MKAPQRSRPTRRIETLEAHPAAHRWDLCLMAMVALLGFLAQPAAR